MDCIGHNQFRGLYSYVSNPDVYDLKSKYIQRKKSIFLLHDICTSVCILIINVLFVYFDNVKDLF